MLVTHNNRCKLARDDQNNKKLLFLCASLLVLQRHRGMIVCKGPVRLPVGYDALGDRHGSGTKVETMAPQITVIHDEPVKVGS